MKMRRFMHGITLMELMIVVVIVGILTAVAFPNYRSYVTRAKRTEAKSVLLKCAVNQEKFYLQNSRFSDDRTELGFTSPFKSESGTFDIGLSNVDRNVDFTCTATYIPDDNEANKCKVFSINDAGNKTSSPYTDCWTRRR